MKLDHILLLLVGVVIIIIIFFLGVGIVMIILGSEDPVEPDENPLVKYQCSNGRFVSKKSDCPKVTTTLASASTVVTSVSCPVTTVCPKCDCGDGVTTRPTTSPPTTLCKPCSPTAVLANCGLAYYDLTCKNGDSWRVDYSPICGDGCCKWTSSPALQTECRSDETCLDGKCVLRED